MLRRLLCVSAFVPLALAACPKGTVDGYFGDGCYLFVTKPLPWQLAKVDCDHRGGQLATAVDSMINTLLRTLVPTNCSHVYWLGGRVVKTRKNKAVWQWVDGTPFDFTGWATPGQPTTTATMCLVYNLRSRAWYSEMCLSRKPYVCKLPTGAKTAGSPVTDASCTAQTPMPWCEAGWTLYSRSQQCYKATGGPIKWPIAEATCTLLGGHLASIHYDAENLFIKGLTTMGKLMPVCNVTAMVCPMSVWIGLSLPPGVRGTDGPWSWSDGTPLDFRAWALERPRTDIFNWTTYGSIYPDPVDTPESWGQYFNGKWDHLGPNLSSRIGVCKRDY